MKLKFDVDSNQPDPFIFEDNGSFYLYVTGDNGVEAYSSDDVIGVWHFEGIVASVENGRSYWAPSIIKLDEKYHSRGVSNSFKIECDRDPLEYPYRSLLINARKQLK